MCGDKVGLGCYHNDYRKGTIIIPIETNPTVIKHEFIHHILFLTTGNIDLNHNSEWFIKCGGLECQSPFAYPSPSQEGF